MNTRHANTRAQQRGIPPMMSQLLDQYGHEEHDGNGAVILFLDKTGIRHMERDLGRRPVARMAEWLNVYKVVGSDGQTVTIGHRMRRIRRKS